MRKGLMPVVPVFSFSSPIFGTIALLLALAILCLAIYREISLPTKSAALFAVGLLLLAFAAFNPIWHHAKRGTIAVLVDLSPSTRGANFRNPADFRNRLNELIGDAPHQLFSFAAENHPLDPNGPFNEIPVNQTTFMPPAADAIIAFTDARFDLPQISAPVYIVADPGLENVPDASVQKLEIRGNALAATISNTGPQRQAQFPRGKTSIASGTFLVTEPAPDKPILATVKLNPADRWPENDSLSLQISPPQASEKWWIGQTAPNSDWKLFSPTQLPDRPERYLSPSLIVIDNQPAAALSPTQLDRLTQYVRDLGGSILLLGGDHAFAAGDYPGTALEQMSPLASSPPEPTKRWIILADASGSMSQPTVAGDTRWQIVTHAITKLLPLIPPADLVQIGQFSDDIKWWLPPQSATAVASAALPPADALPHGPTNLESALNQIAHQTDPTLPSDLLLLSDCDAKIDDPDDLANRLKDKNIRLNVLAIDHGSALDLIHLIATATGGAVIEQFNPAEWIASARKLTQTALPPNFVQQATAITFSGSLKSLPTQAVSQWNRVWTKPTADLWATTLFEPVNPMGAFWHVGTGSVLALTFEPDPSEIDPIVSAIASKPGDPRFSVKWQNGVKQHVLVEADDNGKFLNDLPIQLALETNTPTPPIPLDQTAPGQYEADIDYSPDTRIATLRIADEIIDRAILAGRYPPEFNAVGNDHDAMHRLASSTNGDVIYPTNHNPIPFHWPIIDTTLAPWISFIALILITTATIHWRNSVNAHGLW